MRMMISIDKDVRTALEDHSNITDIPMSRVINKALQRYFNDYAQWLERRHKPSSRKGNDERPVKP